MKICPVGDEFFHADGQTDGRTDRRRDRNDQAKIAFGNF